jgi:hypothetical protein
VAEAAALLTCAGLIALCMLILIGDWVRRGWIDYRERRDRRIRDKPQADPRAARHRNFSVGGDAR